MASIFFLNKNAINYGITSHVDECHKGRMKQHKFNANATPRKHKQTFSILYMHAHTTFERAQDYSYKKKVQVSSSFIFYFSF